MAFYLLDKPQGITSNKALSFLKREHNISKAGFSGVLDPFATGLLIVATNGDTKFLDLFLHSPKTYTGKMYFGKRTDTLDIDGEIISEDNNFKIDFDEVKKIIDEKYIGKILQVPPKFSNIKINGKRAHELTRKGKVDFELKPVEREIFKFEITKLNDNEIGFEVTASSGTYIRSLARDIGDELNIPSMLTSLRRESIGDVKPTNNINGMIDRREIVPFKFVDLNDEIMFDIINGKEVNIDYDQEDLIAVGNGRTIWIKRKSDKIYRIHKNIE